MTYKSPLKYQFQTERKKGGERERFSPSKERRFKFQREYSTGAITISPCVASHFRETINARSPPRTKYDTSTITRAEEDRDVEFSPTLAANFIRRQTDGLIFRRTNPRRYSPSNDDVERWRRESVFQRPQGSSYETPTTLALGAFSSRGEDRYLPRY